MKFKKRSAPEVKIKSEERHLK